VTTSVRHHPFEYLMMAAVNLVAATVLAIPAGIVLVHALAVFSTAAVQHGNIRLPGWCERALQPVLITVDLHRVHHSIQPLQANANYGAVLSVWDRLFGSLVRLTPIDQQRVVFGVAEVPRHEGLGPIAMILTPWRLGRPPVNRSRLRRTGAKPLAKKRRHNGKAAARAQRV
jgi:sterol desaturase/sphingolipid hydroxylase (fatty acid hydroxylase superfamily)